MAEVDYKENSGLNEIDSLIAGIKWKSPDITYSFPSLSTEYTDYKATDPQSYDFQALTAYQQTAAQKALTAWANVAVLNFSNVGGGTGTIRFGTTSAAATSFAYYPSTSGYGGDVWFGNSSSSSPKFPINGSYSYETYLHEIGHALGLKHPHEDGDIATPSVDCISYTVMSYRSYVGAALTGYVVADGSYPVTPMLDDIKAIQYLYGANYKYNADNTVYTFSPQQDKYFETIWDGGGTDTYDFSAYTNALKIDLRPGYWSTTSSSQLADLGDGHVAEGNVANACLYNNNPASFIENAVGGAGSDYIQGNEADNHLTGNDGNDTLVGADGNDILIGDAGDDSLDGGAGDDQLWGGSGKDILIGGAGSNGYWWGNGDGTDQIQESESNSGDALIFYNLSQANCSAKKDNNNLIFGAPDGSSVVLNGWYAMSGSTRIQGWVFEDTAVAWNDDQEAIVNLADSCYRLKNVAKAIAGNSPKSRLIGGGEEDVFYGGAFSSQLWGGGGNDIMIAGAGNTGFWWGTDDGADRIQESGSCAEDTVFFYNLSQSSCQAARKENSLIFSTGTGNTSLTMEDWYSADPQKRIQGWVFQNTAVAWNDGQSALVNLADENYRFADIHKAIAGDQKESRLVGSSGSDTLQGGADVSQIWGCAGNDVLIGGTGADTFWWGRGDDRDIIDAGVNAATDTLRLYNLSIDDIGSQISGADLELWVNNDSRDNLRITNWAVGGSNRIGNVFVGEQKYKISDSGTQWTKV